MNWCRQGENPEIKDAIPPMRGVTARSMGLESGYVGEACVKTGPVPGVAIPPFTVCIAPQSILFLWALRLRQSVMEGRRWGGSFSYNTEGFDVAKFPFISTERFAARKCGSHGRHL